MERSVNVMYARANARRMLVAAGGLHAVTLAIFFYLILFLPWLRGYMPNVSSWSGNR